MAFKSYPLEGSAAIVADKAADIKVNTATTATNTTDIKTNTGNTATNTGNLAKRNGPLTRASASWTANDGTVAITLDFGVGNAGKYADIRFVSALAVAGAGSSTSYSIHIAETSETSPTGILARYISAVTNVGVAVEDSPTGSLPILLDANGTCHFWCVPDASTTDGNIYVDARVTE